MPDSELSWLPGWRLRELMLNRELSVSEVVGDFLERIESLDRTLHSFITVAREEAMVQARALDSDLASGRSAGPLFGLPVSIKDNHLTRGIRTTAGSLLYRDHVPDEDSLCAERLKAAGAVIVGKTNLPEFALFPRTINLLGEECVNPWDPSRTAGGSSGGAAASVAAALTQLAVGSDGGGSTRIPAALCGVFGLHPSNGRVPRHGTIGGTLAFSGSGPITRDVRDGAMLLQALAGPDRRDPSCLPDPPDDYLANLDSGVATVRALCVPKAGLVSGLDPRVIQVATEAATRLQEAGVTVEASDVSLEVERWVDAFYTMMNAERYALTGQVLHEDPSTRGLLSDYAREHFGSARSISAAEYVRAARTRTELLGFLASMLDGYDVMLTPTVGIVAPLIDGPIVRRPLVAYTFLVNYAGYTAATVPCGFVDGLPVGLHVVARLNQEALLLRVCRAFEQLSPWSHRRPPLAVQ